MIICVSQVRAATAAKGGVGGVSQNHAFSNAISIENQQFSMERTIFEQPPPPPLDLQGIASILRFPMIDCVCSTPGRIGLNDHDVGGGGNSTNYPGLLNRKCAKDLKCTPDFLDLFLKIRGW